MKKFKLPLMFVVFALGTLVFSGCIAPPPQRDEVQLNTPTIYMRDYPFLRDAEYYLITCPGEHGWAHTFFEIEIGGQIIAIGRNLDLRTLDFLTADSYQVRARLVSDRALYLTSDWSDAVTYHRVVHAPAIENAVIGSFQTNQHGAFGNAVEIIVPNWRPIEFTGQYAQNRVNVVVNDNGFLHRFENIPLSMRDAERNALVFGHTTMGQMAILVLNVGTLNEITVELVDTRIGTGNREFRNSSTLVTSVFGTSI